MDKTEVTTVGFQGYFEPYLAMIPEPNMFNVIAAIVLFILGCIIARSIVMYLVAVLVAAVVYIAASKTSFDYNWFVISFFIFCYVLVSKGRKK